MNLVDSNNWGKSKYCNSADKVKMLGPSQHFNAGFIIAFPSKSIFWSQGSHLSQIWSQGVTFVSWITMYDQLLGTKTDSPRLQENALVKFGRRTLLILYIYIMLTYCYKCERTLIGAFLQGVQWWHWCIWPGMNWISMLIIIFQSSQ